MIKRGILLSMFIFFLAFSLFFVSIANADDVTTGLTIIFSNVPPALIATIPNQTWAVNSNLTNAFDLDDFFLDNETLTYSSSSVENITVVINSTTNFVSFYSDSGFLGIRNVTFSASDGFLTADSNVVFLNVTQDNRSPTWSGLSKDKVAVYQNLIVTFSSTWEDNIALSHYIFSIKQESGWVNQSPVSFSGAQNTSSYTIQISAPSGTLVEWRFHGFDTSGNLNSTDISSFTVSASPSAPGGDGGGDSDDDDDSSSSTTQTKASSVIKDFTLSEDSFYIEVKQGSTGTITIEVINVGNVDISFEISVDGLEEFTKTLSDSSFDLTGGESKRVTIEFKAGRRVLPDLYYGTVNVKSRDGTIEIPVVIAIKAVDIEFDLDVKILEEYKEVSPGDVVIANLTLENLKEIEQRNVTLYHSIMDFKGNVIDSSFEEFVFGKRSVSLERSFVLPGEMKKGEYIFFARAVSEKEIVIDSEVFEVGEGFSVAGFIRANFLIFLIVLVSIIVSIMMMRDKKNKEKLRLLNLYLMITELNKLVKAEKYEDAVGIYVKIKSAYGEPVSKTSLENKEELKKEMQKLSKELDVNVLQKLKDKSKDLETEKAGEDGKKEEKTRGEDKKEKKQEEEKVEDKESGNKVKKNEGEIEKKLKKSESKRNKIVEKEAKKKNDKNNVKKNEN